MPTRCANARESPAIAAAAAAQPAMSRGWLTQLGDTMSSYRRHHAALLALLLPRAEPLPSSARVSSGLGKDECVYWPEAPMELPVLPKLLRCITLYLCAPSERIMCRCRYWLLLNVCFKCDSTGAPKARTGSTL